MSDIIEKQQRQIILKRWILSGKSDIYQSLVLQAFATLAWIALSWSIASIVSNYASERAITAYLLTGTGAVLTRAVLMWRAERTSDRAGRQIVDAARRHVLKVISHDGASIMSSDTNLSRGSALYDRTAHLFGYAARWMPGMYMAVLTPIIILIAVATQSYVAAGLLAVSVLTLPLFIWLTASGTAAAAKTQQASLDHLSGVFRSRAAQVGLIKAFRAVSREQATIAAAADILRKQTMKILRIAFLSTAVLEFFASVSIAVVAVYVGFKLLGIFPFETREAVSLREGLMVLILSPEFFAPIRRLSSLHHDRASGVAAANELAQWLEDDTLTSVNRWPRLDEAPTIVFDHATLSRGGVNIVHQLSFQAEPGSLTILEGPSGSGKSSCLQALLGYIDVSAGAITVNGRPMLTGDSLAETVAFVRQSPWVIEGTVAANLRLAAPGAKDHELVDALHTAGLPEVADDNGLNRALGNFGSGLSGGQRQRLALARALLRGSPVLLLDEPTAHLDAITERNFLHTLKSLCKTRTVLIASHRPAVLAAADVIVTLPCQDAERAA